MSATQHDYSKPCTLCASKRDVLVRCQIDETGRWHFVCPGKCWQSVSGGVIDGDEAQAHSYYRYGGMWKNKHDAVSAKKPKKNRKSGGKGQDTSEHAEVDAQTSVDGVARGWSEACEKYTRNDKVIWEGQIWICRRTHYSSEKISPAHSYRYWKEASAFPSTPD